MRPTAHRIPLPSSCHQSDTHTHTHDFPRTDNSGWTFHAGRWTNFPAFAPGDRVGVRLFLKSESESEMACYKNGQFLGVAFNGSRTPFSFPLVPAMCLWKQGDRVRLFPDSFVAERIA